jgi:putative spermidine/putrescine transport system permease protein
VLIALLATFPVAYVLTRMRPRAASLILAAIVASSFVSVILKILGMMIIFAANGPLDQFLIWSRLSLNPAPLVGTLPGVVFGYLHLSISFMAAMLYAVLQTVPVRLEEAARIHGASPWRTLARVVIPLSLPGVVNACLVQFNLLAGAFVTASVLGGGKILTAPVLIQRTLLVLSDYGMAAALSAMLLALVLAVNLLAILTTLPRTIRA